MTVDNTSDRVSTDAIPLSQGTGIEILSPWSDPSVFSTNGSDNVWRQFGIQTCSRLICSACPSAIRRFVVAVGVNPVNSQPFWARPHIGEECLKIEQPSRTYGNAARSVVRIATRLRVAAALFHIGPRDIFSAAMAIAAVAVKAVMKRHARHIIEVHA
jgi:hypothetical protein